ncbi:uncharacterized protein PHACADRAFT_251636 [Phanerochaete carnosa HHB-10118-sp]|uniref:Uncharacterized protein n=1 Tax=Phanerochaete carnosa (strain HHB-10118-sp) TaxID=650164 RepID=K5WFG7_PHACS|nr:uncharacterized protein PHACADRAFT_251636 [Phanerochaete carnosa HHB-10118-sp]EKM57789.1 hypothetical protein PHACADRAFT_251636 [Phanerochaete carnosa HHB-10118-sp]
MGLGGGMIAMNRQAAAEDAYRRRHHPPPLPQTRRTTFYGNEQPSQRTTGFAGSVVNVLRNLFGHSGHQHQEEDRTWISYFDDPWGHEEAELGRGWDIPAEGGIAMPPPPFPKPKATTYEQSYTHPGSPPPGFTWDFADSDVSGNTAAQSSKKVIVLDEEGAVASSSSQSAPQTTATLVCARCMDPLVLPAQAASTEENKERRVWSLRCGHMFDGKCITNLMRPYAEPAEAKMEVDAGETLDAKLVPIVDRKGKGKASDHLAPSTILPHEEDGSIRSRLRPRRVVGFSHDPGVAVQSPSQLPEEVEASSSSRTLRPSSKRARGSIAEVPGATVKGKGRKSRRQRYTWKCPVPDCGLEHVSVLPAGEVEWLMDPHKGAIPLFV